MTVRHQPKSVFGFLRNRCTAWAEIDVRLAPKWLFVFARPTHIIPRCATEGRSWITADESARRQHELALKENLVSVLWVKRPKSGMSTAYQFAVVVTALLRFDIELSRNPGHAIHCGVGSTLSASLERLWEKRRPPG